MRSFERSEDTRVGLNSTVVVILLNSSILSLIVTACIARTDHGNANLPQRQDEIRIRVVDFAQAIAFGQDLAMDWRPDAFLTSADFEFTVNDGTEDLGSSLTFSASGDPSIWYLLKLKPNPNGYEIAYESEGSFEVPRPSAQQIDLDMLSLTPSRAATVALTDPSVSPEVDPRTVSWPASIELRRMDTYEMTGPIVWSVGFRGRAGFGSVHIIIEDATSNIVEIRDYR